MEFLGKNVWILKVLKILPKYCAVTFKTTVPTYLCLGNNVTLHLYLLYYFSVPEVYLVDSRLPYFIESMMPSYIKHILISDMLKCEKCPYIRWIMVLSYCGKQMINCLYWEKALLQQQQIKCSQLLIKNTTYLEVFLHEIWNL